jgi:hypothetical protein
MHGYYEFECLANDQVQRRLAEADDERLVHQAESSRAGAPGGLRSVLRALRWRMPSGQPVAVLPARETVR